MKVILYMAITTNGMIARKNLETPWSDEEFTSYYEKVKEIGNVIVGSRTYPQFLESDIVSMGNPLMVVLTRSEKVSSKENVVFVSSATKALELIKDKGFEQALVTGGGETNKAFLETGLIDEIYLDIEPRIFGEGIPLFSPSNVELKLKLLETKKISDQTIQLHYKVEK